MFYQVPSPTPLSEIKTPNEIKSNFLLKLGGSLGNVPQKNEKNLLKT
jgi:hypothetical protein